MGHLFVRSPFKHWCMAVRAQVIQVLAICHEQEAKDNKGESMTEFNRPTPETLPEKPQFEAITTRLDRIGAESGIKEMTNELYLYGVNVREDLGKEFNYLFHLTRNDTIEEIALHVEKLKGFGKDTIDSLTVYIREMKK